MCFWQHKIWMASSGQRAPTGIISVLFYKSASVILSALTLCAVGSS